MIQYKVLEALNIRKCFVIDTTVERILAKQNMKSSSFIAVKRDVLELSQIVQKDECNMTIQDIETVLNFIFYKHFKEARKFTKSQELDWVYNSSKRFEMYYFFKK